MGCEEAVPSAIDAEEDVFVDLDSDKTGVTDGEPVVRKVILGIVFDSTKCGFDSRLMVSIGNQEHGAPDRKRDCMTSDLWQPASGDVRELFGEGNKVGLDAVADGWG